jgi:hypothetical protein
MFNVFSHERNAKSKLHKDSISPQSDWQSSSKQTINASEDVEERNLHTMLVGM